MTHVSRDELLEGDEEQTCAENVYASVSVGRSQRHIRRSDDDAFVRRAS